MKKIIILLLAAGSMTTMAQNVDQWRGKDRSGIYHETGLLKEWPADGPKMAWHFDRLGKGFSSVIVHDEKLYITGIEGDQGYLYCLDPQGNLLWKRNYGKEWSENFPGSRTTPSYSDGHLYFMSAHGVAYCYEAEVGNLVWKKDLQDIYGAQQLNWGMTESPLVVDDKVIYTPGGTIATMVAFNKSNGEVAWVNTSFKEKTAYCSPLLYTYNGKKSIATCIEKHVIAVDADNGKLLWSFGQTNKWNVHPNTPYFDGKNIYSVTGYGKGAVMLKLSDDGKSVSLGWENSALDNQMGGFIYKDGKLYGSGQNFRSWKCIDAKTGKVLYEISDVGNGAIIYNDGLLYTYSQNGMISLMKPTDSGFEVKGSTRIELGSEQHWAHPVISNGVLYIRHGNVLMAYDIKK